MKCAFAWLAALLMLAGCSHEDELEEIERRLTERSLAPDGAAELSEIGLSRIWGVAVAGNKELPPPSPAGVSEGSELDMEPGTAQVSAVLIWTLACSTESAPVLSVGPLNQPGQEDQRFELQPADEGPPEAIAAKTLCAGPPKGHVGAVFALFEPGLEKTAAVGVGPVVAACATSAEPDDQKVLTFRSATAAVPVDDYSVVLIDPSGPCRMGGER